MKKIASFLACLLVLLSIPVKGVAANAQGSEKVGVLMEEIGVAVSVPADMYVITRKTPKDAYVWNRIKGSADEFLSEMKADGIYFYAFAADNSYVVYAWCEDAEKNASFNLYDAARLQEEYDEIIVQETGSNIIASQRPIYQTGDKSFMVFDYCEAPDSDIVTGRQYWTKHGGKNVNIKLISFDTEITSNQKTVLEDIVDSMIIESKPEKKEESVVLIPEIGVAAALPANMYVLTRGTPKDSEVWADAGFDYEELTQFMLQENAYLVALSGDFSYEIIIRKVEAGNIKDFNTLKTAKLENTYAEFLTQSAGEGVIACQNPIYHTKTKTFLIYDGISKGEDGDIPYRGFWTTCEGKGITVCLYSYSEKVEASHKAVLERIVESMIVE